MSTQSYRPDAAQVGTVSADDFSQHPLDRDDPFARPEPKKAGNRSRIPYEELDPFTELVERGAVLDGFAVEVLEVIPTGDGLEGEATVKHPKVDEREIVDIAELESPPKYGTADFKRVEEASVSTESAEVSELDAMVEQVRREGESREEVLSRALDALGEGTDTAEAPVSPPQAPVSPPQPTVPDNSPGLEEWARNPATDGDATRVPSCYEQEIAQREHIIETCPIDVYCSSINRRWGHRHKLMSYYEARPGAARSCQTLIIDSGVNRWGAPDDILEPAQRYNADYVFATDVTGLEDPSKKYHNDSMPTTDDPGIETAEDAAMEGLRRFMDRAAELGIDDRVILPLQPPYMDFLDRVEAETDWLDRIDYVALGGMKTLSVHEKVRAMFEVRDRLGDEMQIHALDPSTNPIVLRTLYHNPGLIDSLDVSTPELSLTNNKIPDATWKQRKHLYPRGDDITTVRGLSSARLSLQIAFMISPLCNEKKTYREIAEDLEDWDKDAPQRDGETEQDDSGQTSLSQWE